MLGIVALTRGRRRFQKVAAAIIHLSRDCLTLEIPPTPVPFLHVQGARASSVGTKFKRKIFLYLTQTFDSCSIGLKIRKHDRFSSKHQNRIDRLLFD
jgi:hypothetical protein